jgi:hypothetical protein
VKNKGEKKDKKILLLGDSHVRSYSHRKNIIPVFLGPGKEYNLSKSGISNINNKMKKISSMLRFDDHIVILKFGEPNCRYSVNKSWNLHEQIRRGHKIPPDFDKEYIQKCLSSYSNIEHFESVDYVLTPTSALKPTIRVLSHFNKLLVQKYPNKVIDIFSQTVDEQLKIIERFKNSNFSHDPIHLNSNICDVLLGELQKRKVCKPENYKKLVDGQFNTNSISNEKCSLRKSRFGNYTIK